MVLFYHFTDFTIEVLILIEDRENICIEEEMKRKGQRRGRQRGDRQREIGREERRGEEREKREGRRVREIKKFAG